MRPRHQPLHGPANRLWLSCCPVAISCPVVASSGGGVPEIVDDSNGLLFPVGDYRQLALKLREVLNDDAVAAELSLAGRATAARFSWKTLASQYQVAYQDASA